MEKEHILLLIIFSFLLKPLAGANDDCLSASCSPYEPEVRFPFRIVGQQPERCGFPGFDLSCDKQNRTIIRLPSSLSYIVNSISYISQAIYIDPEFCQPNRIVDVNITHTPFSYGTFGKQIHTFYNCSLHNFVYTYPIIPFPCLRRGNYSVFASTGKRPSNCKVMKTIKVPVPYYGDMSEGLYKLEFMWLTPSCMSCEMEGTACVLKSDDGQTICVRSSRRIPKGIIYGLGGGIGVPTLICIMVFIYYKSSRMQGHNNNTQNQSVDNLSIILVPQPASGMGLDGPTIESYPKIVLGESCRLPNDDGICSICLSEYKSKESLRTIPECNHYFHSECVDEWLKLNATCPVCRNTLESSTLVTPCSSGLSSSGGSS